MRIGDELIEVNGTNVAELGPEEVLQSMTLAHRPVELAFVPIAQRLAKPGQSLANKQRDALVGLLDVTERLETWLADTGTDSPRDAGAGGLPTDAFRELAKEVNAIDDDLKSGMLSFMEDGRARAQGSLAPYKASMASSSVIKMPQRRPDNAVRLQV